MKKFIKDIFLKPLSLNLINILIILLIVYLSSISGHKDLLLYLFLLRIVGVSIDYLNEKIRTWFSKTRFNKERMIRWKLR